EAQGANRLSEPDCHGVVGRYRENLVDGEPIEPLHEDRREAAGCRCLGGGRDEKANDAIVDLDEKVDRRLALDDLLEKVWMVAVAFRQVRELARKLKQKGEAIFHLEREELI